MRPGGELINIGGNYYWFPVRGKHYDMGMQKVYIGHTVWTYDERMQAQYFGVSEGRHVFYADAFGDIHMFTSGRHAPIAWRYSDGEPEISLPVKRYDGLVTHPVARDFIRSRIRASQPSVSSFRL